MTGISFGSSARAKLFMRRAFVRLTRISFVFALLICLDQQGIYARADSGPPAPEQGQQELVLGVVGMEYPPFFMQQGGQIGGICVERTRRALERLNMRAELVPLPWNRVLDMARNGEIDGIAGVIRNSKREAFLDYVPVPLAWQVDRFFIRKNTKTSYDGSLSSVAGLPLSVVGGYSYGEDFDTFPLLARRPSLDDRRMTRMVLEGRYPLGIGPISVVRHHARKLGLEDQLTFLDPPVGTNALFLAFSRARNHDGLIPMLAQILAEDMGHHPQRKGTGR